MADAPTPLKTPTTPAVERLNVADRLRAAAGALPRAIAVACPWRLSPAYTRASPGDSKTAYATTTFAELDAEVTRLAEGLIAWGVPPETRLALLVRPSIEFVTLVFALLRAGMVTILIDPGMGRASALSRLAEAEPEGFIAVPTAQVMRALLRRQFPRAKWNVTVGLRWGWGGVSLEQLRNQGDTSDSAFRIPHSAFPDAPAAIIFTSGSTGPAKGVLYTHRMFDTQVSEIQSTYSIEPGGVDLSCFPLFALFNSAMAVTTVLPDMDFSRPAVADPRKLLAAATDWQVTQAFASPAVWTRLSAHCERTGERIDSLRQMFSCGAPVRADVLRSTIKHVAPNAKMHTPYGATECLPVATIEANEVLRESAAKTDAGAGICVGRRFGTIDWKVIRITDEQIASIDDVEELPTGEIGELIVRGPQASPMYVTRIECNVESKIAECGMRNTESGGENPSLNSALRSPHSAFPWHRMGDVGYLDETGRFWYCGRKSQRVTTRNGPIFTENVEAVFNTLPGVRRSALVGVGPNDNQSPVVIVEPVDRTISRRSQEAKRRQSEQVVSWYEIEPRLEQLWYAEQGYVPLAGILFYPSLPVDVRHNAKINREWLAAWAAKRVAPAQHPVPSP